MNLSRWGLIAVFSFLLSESAAQIRLTEVDPGSNKVTIKNFGGSTTDISGYWFCALFSYKALSTMTLESGDLNLASGASVTVSGFNLTNAASDLGLYLTSGSFGSASAMVDFTQWGSAGNGRESVAIAKGIWTTGDFILGIAPYSYIGNGNENGLSFWEATLSSETDILSYSFSEQTGAATIDPNNKAVNVEVANGSDLSSLIATFTLSKGATATVNSVLQSSGATVNDFTGTITYRVTAEDGVTVTNWNVMVTVGDPPGTETDILTFSFDEQTAPATINLTAHTVNIEVAFGTDLTGLIATFTLSQGATASVGTVLQEPGVTANDFSNMVAYLVIAEDGFTGQAWEVTVTQAEVTSVSGQIEYKEVRIYPNPPQEIITIEIRNDYQGPVQLRLMDIYGRAIITKNFHKSGPQFIELLDITRFSGSIMLLQAVLGREVTSRKIVRRR